MTRFALLAALPLIALAGCGESGGDESDDIVVSAEEPAMVEQAPVVDPMPADAVSTDDASANGEPGAASAPSDEEPVDAVTGEPERLPQPDGL
ncbi:hypothetical protein [Aurantiacibacter luteus]|uniref:Argininosuccinate lyase n=1 Tax=Aurantiacibacter luteus TaxID=1581420 RepID=A0A0G9MP45_9SPHN|nr:hypothetical protein [Aurantiacibacter luteus]KLE32480.1 hypothetical protein AAW00_12885 [Aurantiacibacter luteus]